MRFADSRNLLDIARIKAGILQLSLYLVDIPLVDVENKASARLQNTSQLCKSADAHIKMHDKDCEYEIKRRVVKWQTLIRLDKTGIQVLFTTTRYGLFTDINTYKRETRPVFL